MQPRLTRNTTEATVGGVCSGLGEYFGVDPIIVRLIFVLVTLTSGVGVPVYILLLILMPKKSKFVAHQQVVSPNQPTQQIPYHMPSMPSVPLGQQPVQGGGFYGGQTPPQPLQQRVSEHTTLYRYQVPPPSAYRYDPHTGAPVTQPSAPIAQPEQPVEQPSTGKTIKLDQAPYASEMPSAVGGVYPPNSDTAHLQQHRNWRKIGFILICMGMIAFLDQIGWSMSITIPLLMVFGGIMMLRKRA